MPLATVNGHSCYYRIDGDDSRPVVVLAHALGLDHGLWDRQMADLRPHLCVVRYDLRGHGASEAPGGDYSIADLGRDVLALADVLGLERFAFCGLSIGGMVGQWLGANAGERLTALVLANTTMRVADPGLMETRRQTVLDLGMTAVVEAALGRFFRPETVAAATPDVAWARRTLLATSPVGYAACCAAIRDMNQTSTTPCITAPSLVIGGDADVSMPWETHGAPLAQSIAGARSVRLAAAHLSNLERPRSFSAALLHFLLEPPADLFEAGLRQRRAVLGSAHVEASTARATAFTREFQHFITRFAWGATWTRPGLDTRTRRLLVLAVTAALGRWEEFRLHVRTGLAHELELCDLEEVLLQVAVYAGVPAANTAFHAASEETEAARSALHPPGDR